MAESRRSENPVFAVGFRHDGALETSSDGANLGVTLPPLPAALAYALKIG